MARNSKPSAVWAEAIGMWVAIAVSAAIAFITLYTPGFTEPGLVKVVVPAIAVGFILALAGAFALGSLRVRALMPVETVHDEAAYAHDGVLSTNERDRLATDVVRQLARGAMVTNGNLVEHSA